MENNYKKELHDMGITQEWLAEYLGISLKSVNNKLNGKTLWWDNEITKVKSLIKSKARKR